MKNIMEPAKILLINDGSKLLYTMAELLESKGFQAKLTDSAEKALEKLSASFFHMIILKLHRGQIDRLALLHMVNELCPGAKLIIMTDQTPLPPDAYEVKADDYIRIPCRPLDLWRRIFQCLKGITGKPMSSPAKTGSNTINPQNLNKMGLMSHECQGIDGFHCCGNEIIGAEKPGKIRR